ncbi:MAG: diadenosine tetraphosphate hydrolase [Rhodospirillaceae bacterium]|mgnify:CR=1 FL=1|nr:diadenosine tetraphosphate hydrolase [Rhodospirillaceae bacterium]|tara:strand:+ start:1711 stop:2121 length:411 start_codon:yes stop_codon:yes gene_type:complete
MSFVLDPRLEADTRPVCDLTLSTVRLMNDARFPWLILVPMQPNLVELTELDPDQRHLLTEEIDGVSRVLGSIMSADKMNVAALGNMVRQLHVHVIARHDGDHAWPGPVWGVGTVEPYDDRAADALIGTLRNHLTGA